jgi:hypothetical protein
VEATGIDPKRHLTNIVECKPHQNVLQFYDLSSFACVLEHRHEPVLDFPLNSLDHEVPERLGIEFVARSLPLHLPQFPVRVEDPPAQEIVEKETEAFSLGVILKIGSQNMLHVGGICSDNASNASWTLDHKCLGRGSGKNIRCPFQKSVPVLEKFPQNTNYRIYRRTLV